ncbi:MAG: dienelactone hydrolase family protein [Candidatus Eremiobacteraeota bacterium]|nr:dienelactone hydrolase family protein [Candidatus Eremiobacteraeota bacterium]
MSTRDFELNPNAATSPAVRRATFVGLTAGATTALGAAVKGLAQTAPPMGQTHPPLVAEDDPRIATAQAQLAVGNTTISAYAAWPARSGPATPSMVVAMHVWGVDTSIRDCVRRFAKSGVAAIAPDLYGRFGAPSGDGRSDSDAFRAFATRLERAQYVADLVAGDTWLKAKFPETKTGIVGFCMGGHIALATAVDAGARFVAVFPFYGSVDGIAADSLHIPVCGSYGARDTGIPAAEVRAFAAALAVPHDIRIYDEAGHAFFDDQRARYVPSAAQDAWKRTLAFLATYAGPPTT